MTCFDATFQSAALTSARTRIGADGGMSISVPAGQSRLALNLPELRALDLHDSPDLVELDISTAAAAFHLTVIGCPKLDRVKFPPAGAALVHLDSGPHVPELVLEGGVELVDACWAGGQFLLRAEDGTTWDGVHIGRLDPSADRVELTGRGLNVRVGTDRAAESLVVVSLSVKALALVGLGRTRKLMWTDVEGNISATTSTTTPTATCRP